MNMQAMIMELSSGMLSSLKIFFFSEICAAQPHTYSYPLSAVGYQLAAVSAAASIPS